MDKISRGQFTMRIMYEQFANITKMGPMSQVCCSPGAIVAYLSDGVAL